MTRQEFYDHIYGRVSGELKDCYTEDGIIMKRMNPENGRAGGKEAAMFLIFASADGKVSSKKNLDELYELYLTGTNMEEIIGKTVEDGRELAGLMEKVGQNRMLSFDECRDKIFIRLCSKDRKRNARSRQVGIEYEYFRADLCIDIGDERLGSVILPVVKENLKRWGMSRKEVFAAVLERQRKEGVNFFPLDEVSRKGLRGPATNYYGKSIPEAGFDANTMFVLTTHDLQYGASLLLDDEVLETVYEMFGQNYVILPVSTHEAIVFPDMRQKSDEELVRFVSAVNETDVGGWERVCDMAFYYDGESGKAVALPDRPKMNSDQKKSRIIRTYFANASLG